MREGVDHAVLGEAERQMLAHPPLLHRALHSISAVAVCDPTQEHVPFVFVNAAFEELTGYNSADLVDKQFGFLNGPDTDTAVGAELRDALAEGRSAHVVVLHYRKDGSPFWNAISASPLNDDDGRPLRWIFFFHDVTAREAAFEALRTAEERYRRLTENVPEVIPYVLEVENETNWRIAYIAPQVERLLGYPAERFVGSNDAWRAAVHPDDRVNAWASARRRFAGEYETDIEYRLVHRNGDVRWVWDRGTVTPFRNGDFARYEGTLVDITRTKEAESALRRSEEQLRSVISSAPIILSTFDLDGTYTLVEGRGLATLGLKPEDVVGKNLFELYPDHPQLTESARRALAGESFTVAIEFGGFVFETHGSPIRDADGRVTGGLSVATDVTERRRAEERLSHMALHDSLTGLPNRSLFIDRLDHALARCRRERTRCGVLFIDLDRFKRINDSLGHRAGDQILLETADRITSALRADDSVSRLGGDEFTVLCEGIADETEAVRIAEKVAEELGHLYDLDLGELYVTASIGVALSEPDSKPDDLLRDADAAMYRAKSRGRARIELFDDESRSHTVNRLALESGLHGAIERGEFKLYYQPKVSLRSGRVVGYEALLRWDHPTRGLLKPDEFIAVAEDSGLIVPIGRWVLEEAARQVAEWSVGRSWPALMCVNLSARQFAQPDAVQVVADALANAGATPSTLCLEITESVVMEQSHATIATLDAMKDLGVLLALDDFGTGYSSLGYLQRFRLDFLKVDRSFVEGLGRSEERTAIVNAIVKMAQALGLDVVAEGVETGEQVEILRDLGCDLVQGYLFSRPEPPERARELMDANIFAALR